MKILLGITTICAAALVGFGAVKLSACRFVTTGPESGFSTCDDRLGFAEFINNTEGYAALVGALVFSMVSMIIWVKIKKGTT